MHIMVHRHCKTSPSLTVSSNVSMRCHIYRLLRLEKGQTKFIEVIFVFVFESCILHSFCGGTLRFCFLTVWREHSILMDKVSEHLQGNVLWNKCSFGSLFSTLFLSLYSRISRLLFFGHDAIPYVAE